MGHLFSPNCKAKCRSSWSYCQISPVCRGFPAHVTALNLFGWGKTSSRLSLSVCCFLYFGALQTPLCFHFKAGNFIVLWFSLTALINLILKCGTTNIKQSQGHCACVLLFVYSWFDLIHIMNSYYMPGAHKLTTHRFQELLSADWPLWPNPVGKKMSSHSWDQWQLP